MNRDKRSYVRAGVNDFRCGIKKSGARDGCSGWGKVILDLREVAKIRVNGQRRFNDVVFSCKHKHDVVLLG